MQGRYNEVLTAEHNAESLFDAADRFISDWCKTSGWDGSAIIEIECEGKTYRIRQDGKVVGVAM